MDDRRFEREPAPQAAADIDWSNPAAVEALLAADGLADIDSEISGFDESSAAVAIWNHIGERSQWPALPETTVRDTLVRYAGDDLGAAMAADITQPLVPELARDGRLTEEEAEPIDELVRVMRSHGLEGVTIEQVADYLQVDFALGALSGLLSIAEQITAVAPELRTQFAQDRIFDEIEENEAHEYDLLRHAAEFEADDEHMADEEEDDDTVVDDDGESYVI